MNFRHWSLYAFKLLALLATLTSLSACRAESAAQAGQSAIVIANYSKINIKNDVIKNGIFDISVEYGADGTGWMAYSRVSLPKYVETRLARSTDHGKTWEYVSTVNISEDGMVYDGDKKQQGIWRYETPSLLYDPKDIPSRRWKLFSHRYLSKPPYKKGTSLFANGWIEYKVALSPEGPWSRPACLFGAKANKCKIDPNTLHSSLKENVFYSEIGSITVNGVIYLSVDSSTTKTGLGEWRKRKVVLFSSSDHGETWRFAGTLTDYDDANDLGYLVLTGTSLVREDGRLYLLVTPSGRQRLFIKNRAHDGTYVLEFDDISKASLKRDKKGKLIIGKIFKPEEEMHSGGLSDYDEQNTSGGVLFSQISTDAKHYPGFFQVFSTGERIR